MNNEIISIKEVFREKEKKKEEQRKKKDLLKEADSPDQKTNSFTRLESPSIYTGNIRNRKVILLFLPATGTEGGVNTAQRKTASKHFTNLQSEITMRVNYYW